MPDHGAMGLGPRFVSALRRLLAWGVLGSVLGLGLGLGLGLAQATPVAPTPTPTPTPISAPGTVEVQDGDMASVLAFRLKPRGATIEQMMVAMLTRNPEAFILGNVNLLKQGAVLRLPSAEEVLRLPPEQARDIVQRHHQASLADLQAPNAPTLSASASASASGSAPAPMPERTASAPSETATATAADAAAERQALLERLRLAKARLDELQHNIQELERLTQAPAQALPQASHPAASPPSEILAPSGWPTSWIWLGVGAIVAIMIGVGYSRASAPPHVPANASAAAAAEFQARLSGLDLDLGDPPGPPPSSGRTP